MSQDNFQNQQTYIESHRLEPIREEQEIEFCNQNVQKRSKSSDVEAILVGFSILGLLYIVVFAAFCASISNVLNKCVNQTIA